MTDALHFPLMFSRDGLDPIAELGERRDTEPVSKLELPFGITAWLVTGYDAAKQVLADATSFSNAFGNLTSAGTDDEQDPGRAGDDRSAVPHPAAQDADPGIHHAPAEPAASRGSRPSSTGSWTRSRRPVNRPTWWTCSRCRSRRW